MPPTVRILISIGLIALIAGSGAVTGTGHAYKYRAGIFVSYSGPLAGWQSSTLSSSSCALPSLPASWHVPNALRADLTGDGSSECVLLVWRPWQDWPIMRWSDTASPIATHRDADGDSAHIVLMDPSGAYQIWAGSALALPIVEIAVGDVDGDGGTELVALEGDYATGRGGPARHVGVWAWNGFGFTLAWRSPPGRFLALALADLDGDGTAEILAR